MGKKTIIMLENKNRMQQVENELLNFWFAFKPQSSKVEFKPTVPD